MKITNRTILLSFVRKHTNAVNAVNKWVEIIEDNEFANHNELKSVFPSADYVGNGIYIFNIKGNKYRFVVLVMFMGGVMQIKYCGTHAEYDKIKNIENI